MVAPMSSRTPFAATRTGPAAAPALALLCGLLLRLART
jgi:hypothetical protein